MSDDDRARWNARYADGAFRHRDHPSDVLREWLAERLADPPKGRALDVACGAGRNAVFLASRGWQVDAVDISAVALDAARRRGQAEHAEIRWIEHDLELGLPTDDIYDLVIMVRYHDPKLLASLAARLQPGGKILVEEHLVWDGPVVGPSSARFRVQPGELRRALSGLTIEREEEGLVRDPDGREAALARVLATNVG